MKTAILLPLCLLFTIASATHNRGGEILYKRIAPTTTVVNGVTTDYYKYRITVKKYFDHGSGIADRCQDTVYFGDGTAGVAYRVNGTNTCGATCMAPAACGSVVISVFNYVVKENIYEVDHVYPGPGFYTVYSFDPNRNNGIVNIPNSVLQPFFIRSLIVVGTGTNSSPVSANYPLGTGDNVNCFYHNPQATDAEGDSLSYELWASETKNGTIPGFTFPSTGTNGYFFITNQGLLHWCWPQAEGEYNFGIKIREWRKNNNGVYMLNGYVFREYQVVIRKGVLGVDDTLLDNNWLVYPNPFSNTLELKTAGDGQTREAVLYSADGREAAKASATLGDPIRLNTQALAPGIYLLQLKNGEQTSYRKVIKD